MTGCRASDLAIGTDGRVTGLIATNDAGMFRAQAGAVVLCAGDYTANRALLRRFAPEAPLAAPILSTHTGDAHAMAVRIGAVAAGMERIRAPHIRTTAWPHIEPSPELLESGAVIVDRKGRIQPRNNYGIDAPAKDLFLIINSYVSQSLASSNDDVGPGRDGWQRTGRPFIGTSPDVAYAYLEDCEGRDWYLKAESIEDVAERLGCDVKTLAGLGDAPFHIIGPARRYLMGVGGALATGTDMAVLDTTGSPIPNLYAAGEASAWMEYAGGHGYGISWATTSGRLAGATAVA